MSGTSASKSGFSLSTGSAVSTNGATAPLWSGKNPRISAAISQASSSSSAIKQAIPDLDACKLAPPSPEASISPSITSGVSKGEERNSCPCSSPRMVKSAKLAASEETPTTGPKTRLIIGTLPLHWTSRSSNSPVPASPDIPSWALCPPPSHMPIIGTFARSAISTTLAIFLACVSPILPP